MATSRQISRILFIAACYAYCFLFLYAAVSKLLDYNNFVVQIGQSPLLSAFAGWISWLVPALEIIIAIGLLIPRCQRIALIAAFLLMVKFSAYIFFIMNFSAFVPCSCGGILEAMSWKQHLIFNIAVCLLGLIALLAEIKFEAPRHVWKFGLALSFSTVIAVAAIGVLHVLSEDQMHNRNAFVRRFPVKKPIEPDKLDIKFPTYHFAGADDTKIYLGNTTATRHVLIVSKNLRDTTSAIIKAEKGKLDTYAPRLKIWSPYFYIVEGNIPFVIKGTVSDWKSQKIQLLKTPFSHAEPSSDNEMLFRHRDPKSGQYELASLNLNDKTLRSNTKILTKQIDGLFDADGILASDGNNFAYVYYYRNEIIRIDKNLEVLQRFKTIDTISKAEIKVFKNPETGEMKLGGAPVFVNRLAAIDGKYLFINSPRVGKYEPEIMFRSADIIDIYDMEKGKYLSSFYYYKEQKRSLKSFIVRNRTLFALHGKTLSATRLDDQLFE